MDIFGIGILEAFFILLIMLVILGPADMVKLGRQMGEGLRKLWTSPTWQMIFKTSNSLRNLPNALAREAGLEQLQQELKRETEQIRKIRKELAAELAGRELPTDPASAQLSPDLAETSDGLAAWTTPIPLTSLPEEAENSILPPERAAPRPGESTPPSPPASDN